MGRSEARLLAIPTELRLIIYESLWVSLSIRIANDGPLTPSMIPTYADLNPLLVCRQIYSEARQIAYLNHTFVMRRNFDRMPLTWEPQADPYAIIRSIAIPGYRPPPPTVSSICSLSHSTLSRCYTFKEICSLVRRFRNLAEIIILTDQVTSVGRALKSRKGHITFRMKKAKHLRDERFLPGYDLIPLRAGSGRVGWRLSASVGDGSTRSADIMLEGLKGVEGRISEENELS